MGFHVSPFSSTNLNSTMSLAALAQEKFWENKAQCEDAEKAFHMGLSGAKAKVDVIEATAAATGGAVDAGAMKKLKDLELENKDLKKVTADLKAMVLKLENRVSTLERGAPAAAPAAAPAPAKAAPAPAAADDEDSDCDLFGSDSESEDDE